jgi:DNA-binding protein HU-beta
MALSKRELLSELSKKTGESQASCERVLTALISTIVREVKSGEDLTVTGLGTFHRKLRAARKGVNPATGAAIKIAAAYKPAFRPAKPLRDAMPRVKRGATE